MDGTQMTFINHAEPGQPHNLRAPATNHARDRPLQHPPGRAGTTRRATDLLLGLVMTPSEDCELSSIRLPFEVRRSCNRVRNIRGTAWRTRL